MKASLNQYRKKRNFRKTAEPAGALVAKAKSALSFVVQKHAARRLHYDFRLELDGVLKSWAVPKGPSLDPAVKALAVHVEDHPIEYGKFEGTIPAGQYGGGTVMLWDRGSWTPIGEPSREYIQGKFRFQLHGERLKGEWHLVRMSGKAGEDGKNWLLIKTNDSEARPGSGHKFVDRFDTSVTSGRTMDEIAGGAGASARNGVPTASRKPAKRPPADARSVPGARARAQPTVLKPQLATLANHIPDGDDWLHELKLDGYRLVCVKKGDVVRLLTRRGQNWTKRFPTIADAIRGLAPEKAILDGEVVVLAADGTSDFQALQNSLSEGRCKDHVFFVFDMPFCDGYDLTQSPLLQRKQLLSDVLPKAPANGPLRYSDHIRGRGDDVIRHACRHGLEGTISKHVDSPYTSARSRNWIKVKCRKRQEFVVGGWTDPDGARKHFGALLLGWYDGDVLRYCGRVGTGFTSTSLKEMWDELSKRELTSAPFINAPRGRTLHWAKPEVVVEVEFANWTDDGNLRQAAFLGMREDKQPTDITRERAVSSAETNGRMRRKPTGTENRSTSVLGVRLTSPERIVYPDQSVTKKQLAEYYAAIADWMLPYVQNRPLIMVRCPEGRAGKCFFQRHVTAGVPEQIHPISIKEKGETQQCLSVRDAAGLVALVQLNALEIHVWGSSATDVERPTWLVFDLDPGDGVEWKSVIEAARNLRDRLLDHNLQSFVRTTGGKGLHIVAPIEPEHHWPSVKQFTRDLADAMVRKQPERYIATASKAKRKGKIFIDYLRNDRSATAICNYSTRARDGVPIATPIRWDELSPRLKPAHFDLMTVLQRVKRLSKDPWDGFFTQHQSLRVRAAKE